MLEYNKKWGYKILSLLSTYTNFNSIIDDSLQKLSRFQKAIVTSFNQD